MSVKRILIAGADAPQTERIQAELRSCGPGFDVIAAADGAEALKILDRATFDLVLAGLHARMIDGFQLLTAISRRHPNVKVLVLVEPRTRVPRAMLRLLGAPAAYGKEVDLPNLADAVCAELQVRRKGEVWGISLTSFLQMLNADQKTCALTIEQPGQSGCIYLKDGELEAAEYGSQEGEDALYTILAWDEPVIEIDYRPYEKAKNISAGFMGMLLESQRRKDTLLAEKLQMRRYPRFNCLMAVDYDLQNGRCRHLIRNLSEGGAFVESDAKVQVGQEIVLFVHSLRQEKHCAFRGRIMRIGSHGFGVQFLDMSDERRAFLREMLSGPGQAGGTVK